MRHFSFSKAYPPYGRAEPRSVESEDSREATRSRTTRTTPIPRRKHGRPHFTRRPKTKPSTRQTTTQNRTTISTSSGPDATNEHPEIDLESVGQRHKPRPPTPKPPPPDRPPLPGRNTRTFSYFAIKIERSSRIISCLNLL